jgi:hypothetical protein
VEEAPLEEPSRPTGSRRHLAGLASAYGVLLVCGTIGTIFSSALINSHPAFLLVLNSRMRHLLFSVAAGINPVAYAFIGFVRLSLAAWVCFGLGYSYGDRGIAWMERQLQGDTPATFRWLQRAADKAGSPLSFFFPGSNIACALVGQRKLPPRRFGVWLSCGIVFRLIWVWIAARLFDDLLKTILRWIDKYQWWLVIAFFALTVLQSLRKASTMPPPPPQAS